MQIICIQLIEALQICHEANIKHRDINPSNILGIIDIYIYIYIYIYFPFMYIFSIIFIFICTYF